MLRRVAGIGGGAPRGPGGILSTLVALLLSLGILPLAAGTGDDDARSGTSEGVPAPLRGPSAGVVGPADELLLFCGELLAEDRARGTGLGL